MNKKLLLIVPAFTLVLAGCGTINDKDSSNQNSDVETSTAVVTEQPKETFLPLNLNKGVVDKLLETFDNAETLKNYTTTQSTKEIVKATVDGPKEEKVEMTTQTTDEISATIGLNTAMSISTVVSDVEADGVTIHNDLKSKEYLKIDENINYAEENTINSEDTDGLDLLPGNFKCQIKKADAGSTYMNFARYVFNKTKMQQLEFMNATAGKEYAEQALTQALQGSEEILNFKLEKSNLNNSKFRFSYQQKSENQYSESLTDYSTTYCNGHISEKNIEMKNKQFTVKEDGKTKVYGDEYTLINAVSLKKEADNLEITMPNTANYKAIDHIDSNSIMKGLTPNVEFYEQPINNSLSAVKPLTFEAGLKEITASMKTDTCKNVVTKVFDNYKIYEQSGYDPEEQKHTLAKFNLINYKNDEINNKSVVLVDEALRENALPKPKFASRFSSHTDSIFKEGNAYTYVSQAEVKPLLDSEIEMLPHPAKNEKGNKVLKGIKSDDVLESMKTFNLIHPEQQWNGLKSMLEMMPEETKNTVAINKIGEGSVYNIMFFESDKTITRTYDYTIENGRVSRVQMHVKVKEKREIELPSGTIINGFQEISSLIIYEEGSATDVAKIDTTGFSVIPEQNNLNWQLLDMLFHVGM